MTWPLVHLVFLVGFLNRVSVLPSITYSYFGYNSDDAPARSPIPRIGE